MKEESRKTRAVKEGWLWLKKANKSLTGEKQGEKQRQMPGSYCKREEIPADWTRDGGEDGWFSQDCFRGLPKHLHVIFTIESNGAPD